MERVAGRKALCRDDRDSSTEFTLSEVEGLGMTAHPGLRPSARNDSVQVLPNLRASA
jgi:hypothetical protein